MRLNPASLIKVNLLGGFEGIHGGLGDKEISDPNIFLRMSSGRIPDMLSHPRYLFHSYNAAGEVIPHQAERQG